MGLRKTEGVHIHRIERETVLRKEERWRKDSARMFGISKAPKCVTKVSAAPSGRRPTKRREYVRRVLMAIRWERRGYNPARARWYFWTGRRAGKGAVCMRKKPLYSEV